MDAKTQAADKIYSILRAAGNFTGFMECGKFCPDSYEGSEWALEIWAGLTTEFRLAILNMDAQAWQNEKGDV